MKETNIYKVQMNIRGTEADAISLRKSLAQCTCDEFELEAVFDVNVELETSLEHCVKSN